MRRTTRTTAVAAIVALALAACTGGGAPGGAGSSATSTNVDADLRIGEQPATNSTVPQASTPSALGFDQDNFFVTDLSVEPQQAEPGQTLAITATFDDADAALPAELWFVPKGSSAAPLGASAPLSWGDGRATVEVPALLLTGDEWFPSVTPMGAGEYELAFGTANRPTDALGTFVTVTEAAALPGPKGLAEASDRVLASDRIGDVVVGGSFGESQSGLTALLGDADADTGWEDGCIMQRRLQWGGGSDEDYPDLSFGLTVIFYREPDPTTAGATTDYLHSWHYFGGGGGIPAFATTSGLRVGDTLSTVLAVERTVSAIADHEGVTGIWAATGPSAVGRKTRLVASMADIARTPDATITSLGGGFNAGPFSTC